MKGIERILFVLVLSMHLARIGASQAESREELRIGVIAGLSGDYAPVFQNFVDGITLAHEDYAAKGLKPSVRLYVEDDEFRAAKGLSAYQKLTGSDKIEALINGSSMTIGAIYPLVTKKSLPVIQLGEETEEPKDDNVLQIMPGNIELEQALGKHLSALCPQDSPLFYSIHPTMERFARAFKQGFGGHPTTYELDPAMSDVKSVVVRALAAKPRCAIILAFPAQGAQLAKEIHSNYRKPLQLAFDGNLQSGVSEYRTILGSLAPIQDAIVAVLPSQTSVEFQSAFTKRFGRAPGLTADMGYDAFLALLSNYKPQSEQWIASIKAARFEGVSGRIEFDAVGVRRPVHRITTVREFFGEP